MITIERASRITSRFGLGFTEDYILRCIQRGELQRVPKPYNDVRDSSYGYGVSTESLAELLLNKGVTKKEITEVLPM